MLNEFRSTYITWDKATSRIYSPVTANASDENGRKLVVQIVNSGQVEDLTGATLHLYWETRDKAHDGLDVFKAVDLKKGEFELSYTTGMLSNHGVLNANLVLIDTVGRVVSERFKITVTEGIDNDAIQSENSFSSLTQALIDISDLEQNYAPRLNDLTAQLQQTGNQIITNAKKRTELNSYKRRIPMVSFVDDDGNPAILTKLLPLKQKYGIPFTVCVPSDHIINGGTLTVEQLKDLQNNHGFEIATHAKTHQPINENMPREQVYAEVYESWRQMREWGLDINTIVYPFGQATPYTYQVASRFYKAGVSTDTRLNGVPLNTYRLGRFSFPTDGWTLADYKNKVDEAIEKNVWLIWMLHCGQAEHDAQAQQTLDDLIAYIQSKNVEITTIDDGIDIVGNVIDINNQKYYMGSDGTNNIVNYVPSSVDPITGKEPVNFDTTPDQLASEKTYVSSISNGATLSKSPSGLPGILTIHVSNPLYNSYRTYIDREKKVYIQNANTNGTGWHSVWSEMLTTTGSNSYTTENLTIPPKGVARFTIDHQPADYGTNQDAIVRPVGILPAGVMLTAYHRAANGGIEVRLFNSTDTAITMTNFVWRYSILKFK